MFALGLMGSPRKKGNTAFLLSTVMAALEQMGAKTQTVYVPGKHIKPCIGCTHCEKYGYCVQKDDDMAGEMFGLLRRADIIVAATPIYFYNATAQLKLFIDRTQTLWSRKYKLGLDDPRAVSRSGFMLAVGATKGRNLFEGMHLTAKYFFDAVRADFSGELGYRRIEDPGDMARHEGLDADVGQLVNHLAPLFSRQKLLFIGSKDTFRAPLAAAFAMGAAGRRVEVKSAGVDSDVAVNPRAMMDPLVEAVMPEKGVDMAFFEPQPLKDVLEEMQPDVIVTMDKKVTPPDIAGAVIHRLDIPPIAGRSIEAAREIRDAIETRVQKLIEIM
ncbi:MAG: NAD(P)H-dependent oxidoreductase [Thermodesulfobacteriota bacterium]|nr:NAD(P)H-dependent oxidoreductase [Thermodesulfobacteriota bacterium]